MLAKPLCNILKLSPSADTTQIHVAYRQQSEKAHASGDIAMQSKAFVAKHTLLDNKAMDLYRQSQSQVLTPLIQDNLDDISGISLSGLTISSKSFMNYILKTPKLYRRIGKDGWAAILNLTSPEDLHLNEEILYILSLLFKKEDMVIDTNFSNLYELVFKVQYVGDELYVKLRKSGVKSLPQIDLDRDSVHGFVSSHRQEFTQIVGHKPEDYPAVEDSLEDLKKLFQKPELLQLYLMYENKIILSLYKFGDPLAEVLLSTYPSFLCDLANGDIKLGFIHRGGLWGYLITSSPKICLAILNDNNLCEIVPDYGLGIAKKKFQDSEIQAKLNEHTVLGQRADKYIKACELDDNTQLETMCKLSMRIIGFCGPDEQSQYFITPEAYPEISQFIEAEKLAYLCQVKPDVLKSPDFLQAVAATEIDFTENTDVFFALLDDSRVDLRKVSGETIKSVFINKPTAHNWLRLCEHEVTKKHLSDLIPQFDSTFSDIKTRPIAELNNNSIDEPLGLIKMLLVERFGEQAKSVFAFIQNEDTLTQLRFAFQLMRYELDKNEAFKKVISYAELMPKRRKSQKKNTPLYVTIREPDCLIMIFEYFIQHRNYYGFDDVNKVLFNMITHTINEEQKEFRSLLPQPLSCLMFSYMQAHYMKTLGYLRLLAAPILVGIGATYASYKCKSALLDIRNMLISRWITEGKPPSTKPNFYTSDAASELGYDAHNSRFAYLQSFFRLDTYSRDYYAGETLAKYNQLSK